VFHLNTPPPPQSAVAPAAPPDLPVITFNGFMKNAGLVKVLLTVAGKAPAGQAGDDGPKYLALSQGEKEGPVELVKVDVGAESIDIINSGTSMTLTMKKNGLAETPPPPAANPALRRVIPGAQPLPQAGIQDNASGTLVGGVPVQAPRPFSLAPNPPAQQPAYTPQANFAGYNPRPGHGGQVLTGGGPAIQPVVTQPTATTIPLRGLMSNLGDARSMAPNSTPPPTQAIPPSEMPPVPGMPSSGEPQ
jgi:hypothetical protein